jgi:vacuolar-type H+-ATPase subunit E/Vma4
MSISNIINHLELKHKERLAELAKDKKARLLALEKQWADRLSEGKSKILDEYKQKTEQTLSQLNFKQKEAWQREVLQKKQNLMDELMEDVYKDLMNLSNQDYGDLLAKSMLKLPEATGQIQISEEGNDLCKKTLKKLGRTDEILVNKKMNDRGFIYSNGKVVVDYTFRFVLRQVKNDHLIELNNDLFE